MIEEFFLSLFPRPRFLLRVRTVVFIDPFRDWIVVANAAGRWEIFIIARVCVDVPSSWQKSWPRLTHGRRPRRIRATTHSLMKFSRARFSS
jgi:hypothetical protein